MGNVGSGARDTDDQNTPDMEHEEETKTADGETSTEKDNRDTEEAPEGDSSEKVSPDCRSFGKGYESFRELPQPLPLPGKNDAPVTPNDDNSWSNVYSLHMTSDEVGRCFKIRYRCSGEAKRRSLEAALEKGPSARSPVPPSPRTHLSMEHITSSSLAEVIRQRMNRFVFHEELVQDPALAGQMTKFFRPPPGSCLGERDQWFPFAVHNHFDFLFFETEGVKPGPSLANDISRFTSMSPAVHLALPRFGFYTPREDQCVGFTFLILAAQSDERVSPYIGATELKLGTLVGIPTLKETSIQLRKGGTATPEPSGAGGSALRTSSNRNAKAEPLNLWTVFPTKCIFIRGSVLFQRRGSIPLQMSMFPSAESFAAAKTLFRAALDPWRTNDSQGFTAAYDALKLYQDDAMHTALYTVNETPRALRRLAPDPFAEVLQYLSDKDIFHCMLANRGTMLSIINNPIWMIKLQGDSFFGARQLTTERIYEMSCGDWMEMYKGRKLRARERFLPAILFPHPEISVMGSASWGSDTHSQLGATFHRHGSLQLESLKWMFWMENSHAGWLQQTGGAFLVIGESDDRATEKIPPRPHRPYGSKPDTSFTVEHPSVLLDKDGVASVYISPVHYNWSRIGGEIQSANLYRNPLLVLDFPGLSCSTAQGRVGETTAYFKSTRGGGLATSFLSVAACAVIAANGVIDPDHPETVVFLTTTLTAQAAKRLYWCFETSGDGTSLLELVIGCRVKALDVVETVVLDPKSLRVPEHLMVPQTLDGDPHRPVAYLPHILVDYRLEVPPGSKVSRLRSVQFERPEARTANPKTVAIVDLLKAGLLFAVSPWFRSTCTFSQF